MELEDLRRVMEEQLKLSRKLKARVAELEAKKRAPIAVVGTALRFPGGLTAPDDYWRFLRTDGAAISEIPEDRKGLRAAYDPRRDQAGRSYVNRAGFLKNIADFDAGFFGISQREAEALDPQQRLLLETSWEAFERAGIPMRRHERLPAAVFIGIMASEYGERIAQNDDKSAIDPYYGTGGGHCFAAGRISYALGFSGSAISVDTACSSSLVALHLGAQSLRNDDCKYALVGGSNLILSADLMISLCQSKALAPDGRSKTFTAQADGYGRGEGIGVLVLMRLADAEREGHPILAVLRGTATNHDGASSGLTVPSGPAQQEVIRSALDDAGVAPSEVGYVEAHGTGTALGDPIEIAALDAVLGSGAGPRNVPLTVGSVKSRLGHLEAAAGVAGIIKLVLMLQNGELPASLSESDGELNKLIPWSELGINIPRRLARWPKGLDRRIAGVSAFGLSGTNSHAVFEAYAAKAAATRAPAPLELLTLSAKDQTGLRALVQATNSYLAKLSDEQLASACHTVRAGRAAHRHRLCIVGGSKRELLDKLTASLSLELESGAQAAVLSTSLRLGADLSAIDASLANLGALFPVIAGLRAKTNEPRSALEGLLNELGIRCKTVVDSSLTSVAAQLEWGNRIAPLCGDNPSEAPSLLLEALASLYESGADVRFALLATPGVKLLGDLPTYPFQRKRYWIDEPSPQAERGRKVELRAVDDTHSERNNALTPADVEAFLLRELQDVLRAEGELDCTQTFLAVGGDSFMAMMLKRSVEQTYEVEIPLEDLSTELPLAELLRRLSGHVLKDGAHGSLQEKTA